jgi:effector-binding domain-containing protein
MAKNLPVSLTGSASGMRVQGAGKSGIPSGGGGAMSFVKGSFAASLGLAFIFGAQAWAQTPATPTPPARAAAAQVTPAPTAPASATPTNAAPPIAAPAPPPEAAPPIPSAPIPNGGEGEGLPGVPDEATTEMIDVPSRTTAVVTAKAKWDDGFASIKDSFTKIRAALDKAGLKPAGSPFTVFTQTDDNGFSYEAMVPLVAKPAGELAGDVKFGSSPSGKAIKFQHRGPYDDIDSTYDLITAYLDEKDLEARDFFIEEYLTELTSAEDPNLAVDIYVFIK